MNEYLVLARKYRPQSFSQVLGQEAIVTTLKNAIRKGCLAHAYLFCGSRGTGKTTLARLFAKALNCAKPTETLEPCNHCSSCKEIMAGNSLDVLEIDGASHRGIDDVRQINDTVGYTTASGKYKVYIIDEVHMLTKEAFNALLKTLEEPPAGVLFFFATTEPHKVPLTILSRCQRFNLNRISLKEIMQKLRKIAEDFAVEVDEEALRLLAIRADGALRDAESLFDQILTFQEGKITVESVTAILGIVSRESFFTLDKAGKEGNLTVAFEIAHQVFSQGKDVGHFLESLLEHFRTVLLVKLVGKNGSFLNIAEQDLDRYEASAKLYSREQCLAILDFLMEAQSQSRYAQSSKIVLETLLLRILRIHQRVPVDLLVRRLADLEQKLHSSENSMTTAIQPVKKELSLKPPLEQLSKDVEVEQKKNPEMIQKEIRKSITEDPHPSKADLGFKEKIRDPVEKLSAPIELGARPTEEAKKVTAAQQSRFDTLMQFAAVELEGTIQKKQRSF